jgi:hypothetical protein
MCFIFRNLRSIAIWSALTGSLLSTTAHAEDWPFRCILEADSEISQFRVHRDTQSRTGYTMVYFHRNGTKGRMAVSICDQESDEYFVVKGGRISPLVVYDRHILAKIPKDASLTEAAAEFQVTFRGVRPRFSSQLGRAKCTRYK